MTTYEEWKQKFNAGGHESFEEFICNKLDELCSMIFSVEPPEGFPGTVTDAAERVTPVEVPMGNNPDAPRGSENT